MGESTSVTIGADGLGLTSYWDQTNGDLKVAHCSDLACSSATTSTIDSAGNVGLYLGHHRRRRARADQLPPTRSAI